MNPQQFGFSGSGLGPDWSSNNTGSITTSQAARATQAGGAITDAAAQQLLLGSVWSAIGQPGQTGGVNDIASALSSQLATGLASGQDLAPQLTRSIDNALDQVAQQLISQGGDPARVQRLVGGFRQGLANAVSNAAAQVGAGTSGAGSNSSAGSGTGATSAAFNSGVSATGSSTTSGGAGSSVSTNSGGTSSGSNAATSSSGGAGNSSGTTSGTTGSGGTSATAGTSATGASIFTNAALSATFGAGITSVVSTSGSVVSTSDDSSSTSGSTVGTSGTAALAVVRGGGSLTIQTTDGAQITVLFGTAGAGVQSQGSGSSNTALLSIGKMQVEVDGTLSSADVQAVSSVLSQVDSLASQYFSGDVQDAFAAAASLSTDPTEIAGMNLQLAYTSNIYQATATSNASAGITQPISAPTQTSTSTGGNASGVATGNTTLGDSASGNIASAGASSSAISDTSTTGTNASPQQIIMRFLREVTGKLGRSTSTGQLNLSSSWKLQVLALTISAYAQQAQAGTATGGALAAATLNQMAA